MARITKYLRRGKHRQTARHAAPAPTWHYGINEDDDQAHNEYAAFVAGRLTHDVEAI